MARPPLVRLLQQAENGRKQHDIHDRGIELRGARLEHDLRRFVEGAFVAIAPGVRHDIKGVRDGHYACRERNALSAQVTRVPRSVPALVMRQNGVGKLRMEAGNGREDIGAACGVSGDGPPFSGRELARLVDDIEERFVNLPDVVKEGGQLDRAPLGFIDAESVADDQGVIGDAANMGAGLLVVGVDRAQQRLETGGRKTFGALASAAFSDEYDSQYCTHDELQSSHATLQRKK